MWFGNYSVNRYGTLIHYIKLRLLVWINSYLGQMMSKQVNSLERMYKI